GVRRAELVAFRKIDLGGRTIFSTSILPPTAHVSVAPADRQAGRRYDAQGVRAYLPGVFSATPAVPAQPKVSRAALDLLNVASAYMTTNLYHDDSGAELQLTDTVYDVRSFTNSADYYYVLQELIAKAGTNSFTYVGTYTPLGYPTTVTNIHPVILQPSPQENPGTTTYTSGVSWSIGGSAGINQNQGLNASLNWNVTVSNSVSVSVPPIQIRNPLDPATGLACWVYWFTKPPVPGDTMTFYDQWIWQLPWSAYDPNNHNYPPSIYLYPEAVYTSQDDPNTQKGQAWIETVPEPFGDTFT